MILKITDNRDQCKIFSDVLTVDVIPAKEASPYLNFCPERSPKKLIIQFKSGNVEDIITTGYIYLMNDNGKTVENLS